jgi:nitroimidazol reductase NimA-like FMN-containing flavoprotein (pyridoxamine 5'-phosphate oxidase superfamily)
MMRELPPNEIEKVLREGTIGRIGCHAEGCTYIVPIAYAYDGECICGQTADGLKVRTLRANPNVCFEVEEIRGPDDWRTVIAWGTYEEAYGHEEEPIARLLHEHFGRVSASSTANPDRHDVERTIYFRVRLTSRTGRIERP